MIENRNGVIVVTGEDAQPWVDDIEGLIEDPQPLVRGEEMVLHMNVQKLVKQRYQAVRTEFLDLTSRYALHTPEERSKDGYRATAKLPEIKVAPDDHTTHDVVLSQVSYGFQEAYSDPMLWLREQGLMSQEASLLLMNGRLRRIDSFSPEYEPAFTDLKRLERTARMINLVLSSIA